MSDTRMIRTLLTIRPTVLLFTLLWCWSAAVSADELYFVHTDHLGTPQVITDANQQTVWEGKQLPFGETDISSSQIEYNLRFPGQYYDQESGLHYNYFRDYDPSLGRYVQSDPIGLNGGLNTYGYVYQNPLIYTDATGEAADKIIVGGGIIIGGGILIGTGICAIAPNSPQCEAAKDLGQRCLDAAEDFLQSRPSLGPGRGPNPFYNQSNDQDNTNTNPYEGPVTEPVIVVDENGNAIPVDEGQQVKGSPNGDYQQVLDSDGKPTGDRLDRGGHKNQKDPRARGPHGHRPGVTTDDGNPHLPIY